MEENRIPFFDQTPAIAESQNWKTQLLQTTSFAHRIPLPPSAPELDDFLRQSLMGKGYMCNQCKAWLPSKQALGGHYIAHIRAKYAKAKKNAASRRRKSRAGSYRNVAQSSLARPAGGFFRNRENNNGSVKNSGYPAFLDHPAKIPELLMRSNSTYSGESQYKVQPQPPPPPPLAAGTKVAWNSYKSAWSGTGYLPPVPPQMQENNDKGKKKIEEVDLTLRL